VAGEAEQIGGIRQSCGGGQGRGQRFHDGADVLSTHGRLGGAFEADAAAAQLEGIDGVAAEELDRTHDLVRQFARRPPGRDLTPTQQTVNHALSTARVPVEHGVARLKSWRIFRRSHCPPNRMSSISAAVLTLERQR
jgi:hypothetical protein